MPPATGVWKSIYAGSPNNGQSRQPRCFCFARQKCFGPVFMETVGDMLMVAFSERCKGFFAAAAFVMGFCLPQLALADEESHQYQDECTSVMSGLFTAQDAPTKVFEGGCSGNRYLQFEDGPRWSLDYYDSVGASYTCVDEETGLDHVVLRTACIGSGCVPHYGVYRVNAEEKALEHVFSMEFMDHDWLHRPLVATSGECLWRGLAKAEAALDAALAPLLVGRRQDADPWDLKTGETLALSPRRLPTEAVINAFGTIDMYGDYTMLPFYVDVMGAEYLSDVARGGLPEDADLEPEPRDRAAFQVLQMKRHPYCGGSGALLVEDMRHRTWTAIRDFGGGDCDRGSIYDEEGMHYLYVKDDKLYARGDEAYEGSWFEVDLRSHTAKRLLDKPQFIAEALSGLDEEDWCSRCGMD